jgi:pimeloyl-ACP methyl ester carboxylesterase
LKVNPRQVVGRVIIPVVIIAMVFLVLAGCDTGPVYQEPVSGTVCRWDFPSSADGFGVPCSVYLPAGYNPGATYPIWVELHALYATPIIDNDPANPFSNELKRIADERGLILLAPWGRNLHSLFVDGISRSQAPYTEPQIYDDFSGGASSWQTAGGSWAVSGGSYRQSDSSPFWKESVRLNSQGTDYSVRVKVRDLTPQGTTSAFGVNFHRADNGDCYHVDLYRGSDNNKHVRLFKLVGGEWQGIASMQYEWKPLTADNWINLKFSCYEDYLEVYVNEKIVNMQLGYDSTPYGYGRDVPGTPLPAGKVSLCSFGGTHEFDDVRIQNEYPYGENDVLDCVLGAMEKYRIDPTRIYVAGHSQGGLGTFSFGLHHPDLCAALRPADGFTDIYYDYNWLKNNFPPNPGAPYANVNDGRLTEYMRVLAGGEASSSYPDRMSVLNGSSARFILENGVNSYWRIVHGTPDSDVPNSKDPLPIYWWGPGWLGWTQIAAPAPYTTATSTYANGKDIADLLQSWSSPGRYYCDYITSATIGHGFLDPYVDTANFFQDKTLGRRPTEVAYKTYDDVNTGAWWLRLQIPNPDRNQPGMARVSVNASANSAAIHARNLSKLSLDLGWMGLDNGAGKTVSFTLDDITSPNVFNITDNTGALRLELLGNWTATSNYTVRLDGSTLGSGYSIEGSSLVLPSLAVRGGHTLTITTPSTLPSNQAPNPGAETDAGGGLPASWTGEVQGGGTFSTLWDDLQMHAGARSLRVKDANLYSTGGRAVWRSSTFSVSPSRQYLLSAFTKARMLKGANQGIGITWYNYLRQPVSTTWVESPGTAGAALNREWSPLYLTASAPYNGYYASIIVGVEGDSSGQTSGSAFFDDISFTAR